MELSCDCKCNVGLENSRNNARNRKDEGGRMKDEKNAEKGSSFILHP
jgi:hypothetical protein